MAQASVFRTLRSRLFLWFLGAIVLAVGTSALVVGVARPEAATGGEVLAHTVGAHLVEVWEDPKATEIYLEEIREVTGFDVTLHRGMKGVPPAVRAAGLKGVALVPAGPDKVWVPIVRGEQVIGALHMEKFGFRPRVTQWWRLAAALAAALLILGLVAGRVSNMLARPLEQLGNAADRFGAGDLAFRTDLADSKKKTATEVRDVAVAFNKMADRLEGMVRGQRELLAAISHELRSPLGRARIAVEIARDRVEGQEGASPASRRSPAPQLDEIEHQLQEVDAILGDLLAVTRAGLADLRKESLALLPWLRARLAEEPQDPPIELHSTVADDVCVAVDAALLGRAVHNLIANARAYGQAEGASLVVRLEARAAAIAILVRDRGPGFPAELLPRVFEPFVRGDASRTRKGGAGGSGLGLALVRRIAEAHGGSAFARNVTAAEGAGAEVGVELPTG